MNRVVLVLALALAAVSCSSSEPDHSPENASEPTRALWEAARTGDLEALATAVEQCADPFVKFEGPDGEQYTAREIARAQRLDPPDNAPLPTERTIALQLAEGALIQAEARWEDACT